MRVLLLEDVRGVGRKMEIREVSDGYARNFLIPKKLAAPANANALQIRASWEKQEKHEAAAYEALLNRLKTETFTFSLTVGANGSVFDSVTALHIKKALEEKGFGESEVILKHPIRTIGVHEVEIRLGRGMHGIVKIVTEPKA